MKASPRQRYNLARHVYARCIESLEAPMIEPIPHVAHSDTSRAAAVSMEESAGTLRSKVLGALNGHYYSGCTDEELQDYLEMPANTERPRRRELQLRGLIRDSGLRRKTRSGRLAVVWVVA